MLCKTCCERNLDDRSLCGCLSIGSPWRLAASTRSAAPVGWLRTLVLLPWRLAAPTRSATPGGWLRQLVLLPWRLAAATRSAAPGGWLSAHSVDGRTPI